MEIYREILKTKKLKSHVKFERSVILVTDGAEFGVHNCYCLWLLIEKGANTRDG